MYYGIDIFGNKVNIEDSIKGDLYCCPVCGGSLIRKFGTQKAHHFAHKSMICDTWYHDNKGEWHKEMQSHFRPDQCEIRIDGENGEFHIADVFIEGKNKNIIMEFQHSPLTQSEFDERNSFYSYHKCKKSENGSLILNRVIWVFDYRDKRMFIDTDTEMYDMSMEKACKNSMCLSVLNEGERYEPTVQTQLFKEIGSHLYARIHWKRPVKIFKNAGSNVYIFFNVRQRRYITGTQEWNGHVSDWYRFITESDNPAESKRLSAFDDVLAEFLVFVSYEYPQFINRNKHLINSQLSHPNWLRGKCITYTDFFN